MKTYFLFIVLFLTTLACYGQKDCASRSTPQYLIGHWSFSNAVDSNGIHIDNYYKISFTDYLFLKDTRFNANQIISDTTPLKKDTTIGIWQYSPTTCEVVMIYDIPFYPFPKEMSESQKKMFIDSEVIFPVKETYIKIHSISENKMVLKQEVYEAGKMIDYYYLVYSKSS